MPVGPRGALVIVLPAWLLSTALPLLTAAPAEGQTAAAPTVRALLASARHPWARWPDFSRDADAVRRLYRPADEPLWIRAGRPAPAALAAIAQLLSAREQGLDPGDYDAEVLDSIARRLPGLPPAFQARFDVLLTVDLMRLLGDVRHGRLRDHPLAGKPEPAAPDPAALVSAALAGETLPALVRAAEPPLAQYRLLRRALARFRALAADTTIGGLTAGRFLWPGSSYDSLARLGRTLVALGDLSPDSASPGRVYDGAIVAAVRRFQQRHALAPDGVLGPRTLAALDAPASDRIRGIELALERLRWVPPIGSRRFLVVNIPAFRLAGFDSATAPGGPSVGMRVVVGHADMRTPILFEQLRYVEFLPYWNVPPSILAREILPMLEWNPGYLRSHDMELVTSRGRVLGDSVTPSALRRLRRGELRVRQRPGPGNALGLVKFIFPNEESIYLHDTPRKERFGEAERGFSHGCISVEHPAALAVWVLRDRPGWTREAVEAAMAGSVTRRIPLREPMPVLVFYTTAVAHADGSMWFYPDVYGHDRELLEALRHRPEPDRGSLGGAEVGAAATAVIRR